MLLALAAGPCLGQSPPTVSLEGAAKVGLPVWPKISTSFEVRYPFYVVPDWNACLDFEVRKKGQPLSRLVHPTAIQRPMIGPGNMCGGLYLPGQPEHPNSIPLHLFYRFEQPGTYEVRYLQNLPSQTSRITSPWTPIEIQPATPADRAKWLLSESSHAPSDAGRLLSGYLPDILGVPDEQSLQLWVPYLSHPDRLVRQYVANGLAYWPNQDVKKVLLAGLHAQGPSEDWARALANLREDLTPQEAESAVQIVFPYLRSNSVVSLTGAIDVIHWIALVEKSPVGTEVRSRARSALIDAESHLLALGDAEVISAYAIALQSAKDDRVFGILWNLVDARLQTSKLPSLSHGLIRLLILRS
jgi:hypothetical protein